MPTEYIVQSGDNLTKIACAHGLRSWRQIYFHPDNVEFRRQRPDPSLIRPGDRLMIPEQSELVTEHEGRSTLTSHDQEPWVISVPQFGVFLAFAAWPLMLAIIFGPMHPRREGGASALPEV